MQRPLLRHGPEARTEDIDRNLEEYQRMRQEEKEELYRDFPKEARRIYEHSRFKN